MAFYVAFQVMTTTGYSSESLGNAGWNHSLRALYGTSKVKNAVHCTDLPEDGALEVDYFFSLIA